MSHTLNILIQHLLHLLHQISILLTTLSDFWVLWILQKYISPSLLFIQRRERESENAPENLPKELPVITVTLCWLRSAQASQYYYPCTAGVSLPQCVSNTKSYSFCATIRIDLAMKPMTGKRLDKLMSFIFGHMYHMHKYVFEYGCVHLFMCRDKTSSGRAEIFKERFKKLALDTCNIHNTLLGIYKTWLLRLRNVDIVAKGAYEIVLLEKKWLYRTTLWKTKELWQDKKSLICGRKPGLQQNLLKS